jgi:hypothetical protein
LLEAVNHLFVNSFKRALAGCLMKVYHSRQENIFVDLIMFYRAVRSCLMKEIKNTGLINKY